ncbi:serine--tRNA ligase [Candidatus Nardonella dryophthoridicola]|uniref:serine--tRNA ligase n=1 Tax=Candidatus Nardonella dryophthoridicola TaxID=1971485 RepID=UPI001AD86849|nr:serine--tRNA ligase [Candidatus Nardonella dryophthoridicola]QTJ62919.1 serine--tRNA ligase [Candidatus Nardonella dryophthoridicola]
MIDYNILEEKYEYIKKKNIERNCNINLKLLIILIKEKKKSTNKINLFRNIKNKITNKILKNIKEKKCNNEYVNTSISIEKNIKNLKIYINYLIKNIKNLSYLIPNILDDNVYDNNIEIYKSKNIKNIKNKNTNLYNTKIFKKNIIFNKSFLISNNKTVILNGDISILNRALINFMLDTHIKNGYIEYNFPIITNKKSLYNSGQLPKFFNNLFYVKKKNSKEINFLIPTSEVQIINIFNNMKIDDKELPIKIVSYTPCFRNEHGFYGKFKKGLIRMNQFDKVEIIQIVNYEKSNEYLEKITNDSENIIKLLDLPYRKILLSKLETPFSSSKTYDLEVFFPSINDYIEVSSCSNTKDFQSRRLNLKYKKNKKLYPHILNASGLAVGRILLAILENNQIKNKIKIPKVLKKYINKKFIENE